MSLHLPTKVLQRRHLPGPEVASTGVPAAEAVSLLLLVAFCWAPVIVISHEMMAWVAALLTLGITDLLLRVRRVVVGADYVAVRRFVHLHVAHLGSTAHLEVRSSERGGILFVHADDGRVLRLRRVELDRPRVHAALRAFTLAGNHSHDRRVDEVLELVPSQRIVTGSSPVCAPEAA
jgi:hypothetical protein